MAVEHKSYQWGPGDGRSSCTSIDLRALSVTESVAEMAQKPNSLWSVTHISSSQEKEWSFPSLLPITTHGRPLNSYLKRTPFVVKQTSGFVGK